MGVDIGLLCGIIKEMKGNKMETVVEKAYVTIHKNAACPVGMVPLSINIKDHTWTMMVPIDEYFEALNKGNK
tara:strand:+ start:59 stop:274 length:216 start_codon:yes stop_codon:yes gene_type:complete